MLSFKKKTLDKYYSKNILFGQKYFVKQFLYCIIFHKIPTSQVWLRRWEHNYDWPFHAQGDTSLYGSATCVNDSDTQMSNN